MDEQLLDASAIDGLDDYELTGDTDDLTSPDQSDESSSAEGTSDDDNQGQQSSADDSSDSSDDHTADPTSDDLIKSILTIKGIKDPSQILFTDESGAEIRRDWNDLTSVEKLNILAQNDDPERDLEDDEIQLINTLRSNNLTPQQYIQAIQQDAAAKALKQFQQSQAPTYEIDELSDDELFALDLLEKVGEENITDEELQEALDHAKSNETLFAKQIEGLRATYKNLEDQQRYNAEQAQLEQAEQQYQDFSNKVLQEIGSFNSFANQDIELSTEDKNDIANYLLTRRDTGISDFYSDMQDPATATLAAFWLLRGPEVLNEMEDQIKAAYQRGFAMGKAKSTEVITPKTPNKPQVVVQQPSGKPSSNVNIQSAFALGDDSYLN